MLPPLNASIASGYDRRRTIDGIALLPLFNVDGYENFIMIDGMSKSSRRLSYLPSVTSGVVARSRPPFAFKTTMHTGVMSHLGCCEEFRVLIRHLRVPRGIDVWLTVPVKHQRLLRTCTSAQYASIKWEVDAGDIMGNYGVPSCCFKVKLT